MIKSELEKQILSHNINKFKSYITTSPINILIKIIPFLCAWGNLSMLNILEEKLISPINILPNKDMFMRMSLLSDNIDIVQYLDSKNCMNRDQMLRYYICSGGNNINIYNLLDDSWESILDIDIKNGIKNGNIKTIQYLDTKVKIPVCDYSHLPNEKQKILLNNNNIFNYYYHNNINHELILEILYNRKIKNITFVKSIVILKIFFRRIKHNFYIIR